MLELGQADPRVRRAAVARDAAGRARRSCGSGSRRGRAPGDARPRRARPRARDAAHRGRDRPAGDRRRHGRGGVRGRRRDPRRDHRVGRLRPGEHPAHRLPLRPALRGEPPLREGPGGPAGPHRAPTGSRSWSRPGPAAPSRPGASTRRPDEPAAGPGRVPAGARQPAPRHEPSATRSRRRCSGASGSPSTPAPAGAPVAVAAGEQPLRVPARRASARDAVVPTWRRDLLIEADVAEEIARVGGYDAVADQDAGHGDAALPAEPAGAPRRDPPRARRAPGSPRS